MKFDHISLSGSLIHNRRHARKYRTWFPREMRTIDVVSSAREDTSMNRIVATMSILADDGLCPTVNANSMIGARSSINAWRASHAQSPKSRVMPGCAAEYRVTSSDTDWRAASRAKWPINAHLEGIVSKRKAAPYRSGEYRDWHKIKTAAWRTANPDAGRRRSWKRRGPRARRSTSEIGPIGRWHSSRCPTREACD